MSARVGDLVTVDVKANADEVAGLKIVFTYDNQALECTAAEVKGFVASMEENVAEIKAEDGEIWLSAMTLDPKTASDEVVLTITFAVLEPAEDVNPIGVDYAMAIYENYQELDMNVTTGAVNVIRFGNGDVNNDGVCDMLDAYRVYRHASGQIVLEGEEFTRGDVVEPLGEIDMMDAYRLYRYASGALEWNG